MVIDLSVWRQPAFWRLNSAILLILPLYFLRADQHFTPWAALVMTLVQFVVFLVLATGLHLCYNRVTGSPARTPVILGVAVLCLVAAVIQSLITHYVLVSQDWHTWHSNLHKEMIMRVLFFLFSYVAWSLLYFWVRAERFAAAEKQRATEAKAVAQQIELQFLRSQLDPHFLFNALNGVATVIPSDPAKATDMVRELADYLRYTLEHREDSVAPFSRELRAVNAYLAMEQARFGEGLRIQVNADPESRKRTVPCFLLQPLVENAVKHSFAHSQPPWDLTIDARCSDDILSIVIRNTGNLASRRKSRSSGIGLDTLRRRLTLLYPDRHDFSLKQDGDSVSAGLQLRGEPCQE